MLTTNPDLLLAQVHAHQRALFDEAERARLLSGALRRRRALKAARKHAERSASSNSEGNLAGCGERAPAPAQ